MANCQWLWSMVKRDSAVWALDSGLCRDEGLYKMFATMPAACCLPPAGQLAMIIQPDVDRATSPTVLIQAARGHNKPAKSK